MPQGNQALKVALAAVEQLPVNLQRQLAEQVLSAVASDEVLIVHLQRLAPAENARLQELMDKNNDGLLTKPERQELEQLGAKVDEMMLENSKLLARVTQPELFGKKGKPIKRLIQAALKSDAAKRHGKAKILAWCVLSAPASGLCRRRDRGFTSCVAMPKVCRWTIALIDLSPRLLSTTDKTLRGGGGVKEILPGFVGASWTTSLIFRRTLRYRCYSFGAQAFCQSI